MGILMMLLVSGCGSSDKFSGIWYRSIDDGSMRVFNIEKNGKDYVVNEMLYEYDVDVENKSKTVASAEYIYNLKLKATNFGLKKQVAIAKDNRLIVEGTMGTEYFNYNEKDGTLTYKGKTLQKSDAKTEKDLVKANLNTLKQEKEQELRNATHLIPTKILEINFNDSIIDK